MPTAKLEEKIEGALPTYVERHITLFTSLHRLSPIYFKQLTNFTLPENILTAPKPYLEDIGIFSITVVDMVPPTDSGDCVNELEYVYRILSNRHIPDSELLRLLDHGSMILEEKDNRTNAIYDQEEEGSPSNNLGPPPSLAVRTPNLQQQSVIAQQWRNRTRSILHRRFGGYT